MNEPVLEAAMQAQAKTLQPSCFTYGLQTDYFYPHFSFSTDLLEINIDRIRSKIYLPELLSLISVIPSKFQCRLPIITADEWALYFCSLRILREID